MSHKLLILPGLPFMAAVDSAVVLPRRAEWEEIKEFGGLPRASVFRKTSTDLASLALDSYEMLETEVKEAEAEAYTSKYGSPPVMGSDAWNKVLVTAVNDRLLCCFEGNLERNSVNTLALRRVACEEGETLRCCGGPLPDLCLPPDGAPGPVTSSVAPDPNSAPPLFSTPPPSFRPPPPLFSSLIPKLHGVIGNLAADSPDRAILSDVSRALSSLCLEKRDLALALDPIVDKLLTPEREYVLDALSSFVEVYNRDAQGGGAVAMAS